MRQASAERVAAIPTRYSGVQFRSRLEARWAAMFDLLGWQWSYEPADYLGWIPDFLIYSQAADLLCEVKGAQSILESAAQEGVMDIWRSAPRSAHVLLLLSEAIAYLREPNHPVPDVAPGAVEPWRVGWGGAVIGRVGDKFDVWHYWGSATPLILGAGSGWPINSSELTALWREAGNRTQWKAPR